MAMLFMDNQRYATSMSAPEDLFILYTGGTTGMPKGVMWPHVALFYAAMNGGGHFHADGPCKQPEDIIVRAREFSNTHYGISAFNAWRLLGSACISTLAGHTVILNPGRSLNAEQVGILLIKRRLIR